MSSAAGESFDREYEALKSGRAVVDLTGWSSISITGADRQKFLNNFCTNDVKRLLPDSSCEAFFPNVKGKIVGHGVVACREDELVFFGPPGQGARLVEHLDRYLIREDVQLRDTTAEKSFALVAATELGDATSTRISWNLIGRDDSHIIESQSAGDATTVGAEAFEAMRIEAGTPLFGVDFNDNNLPQEVGRDKPAISFTKGCYLGQETVARIDAMGHVNQQICGVRFTSGDTIPGTGTKLFKDGAVVGRVTSACYSPRLRAPLALAMIRRGANAAGTQLESAAGDCEVVSLPL